MDTFLEQVKKYKMGEVPYDSPSVIIFTIEGELKLVKKIH